MDFKFFYSGILISTVMLPLTTAETGNLDDMSKDFEASMLYLIESNAKSPNPILNKRLRDIAEDIIRLKYI